MLVLSRKLGETLVIGPDITLTVVEVKGNRVRLGVKAPANVTVLRGELAESWSESVVTPTLELIRDDDTDH